MQQTESYARASEGTGGAGKLHNRQNLPPEGTGGACKSRNRQNLPPEGTEGLAYYATDRISPPPGNGRSGIMIQQRIAAITHTQREQYHACTIARQIVTTPWNKNTKYVE